MPSDDDQSRRAIAHMGRTIVERKPSGAISVAVLAFLIAGLAGCATSVASIKENPDRYVGETVTISGRVERTVTVPFVDVSVFVLSDESGRIPVFSARSYEKGAAVTIEAQVYGVSEDRPVETSEEAVTRVAEVLVEHDVVGRNTARAASERVVELIDSLFETLGGSYFLIESAQTTT